MIDFTNCPVNRFRAYGGANGNKINISYEGSSYMLKFPPRPSRNKEMSYTNGCISEYVACHIFEMLGFRVQDTLLELARTVTDLCGMEDALTANGDEAVHRMEQVWELFRGAVSAEHAERRQALLEEADIQMDELCGCLDPEAEVEDGKQPLTWEELRSELEAVAGALEASEQDAVPR